MQAGLEVCRVRSRRIADREAMGLATGKVSTMASQNLSLEGLNLEAKPMGRFLINTFG